MNRKIRFSQAPRKDFPDKTRLRICLQRIIDEHGLLLESLQYTFTSDEELREMNKQFLRHDYYTDILTFDLSEKTGCIDGDVYISRDRVRDNAKKEKTSIEEEFCRVIAHGMLHLCGYKDKQKSDKENMTAAENNFIRAYQMVFSDK